MDKTDSFVEDLSYWSNVISYKWYIALLRGDIATGDIVSVWKPAWVILTKSAFFGNHYIPQHWIILQFFS